MNKIEYGGRAKFRSRKFLSENFEVAKCFPSREKIEKMQICLNAPTSSSVSLYI
jgi:hypothetical protein